jgi:hypothetical protein
MNAAAGPRSAHGTGWFGPVRGSWKWPGSERILLELMPKHLEALRSLRLKHRYWLAQPSTVAWETRPPRCERWFAALLLQSCNGPLVQEAPARWACADRGFRESSSGRPRNARQIIG